MQVVTFCCCQEALRAKEKSFVGRKPQSVGQALLFFFSEEVLLPCKPSATTTLVIQQPVSKQDFPLAKKDNLLEVQRG